MWRVAAGIVGAMKTLAGVAVALWLGIMACFAFIVAPAAFATLDREAAGRFVGAVFPRYYLAGAILGLVALAGLTAHGLLPGARPWEWMGSALVAAMLGLTLYAWLAVLPAAQAARDAMRQGPAAAAQTEAASFARLHRLSTILNGAVMFAGVLFVVLTAMRRS